LAQNPIRSGGGRRTWAAARAQLGTDTIKDTVNEALRRAAAPRSAAVKSALDRLAKAQLQPREEAWR